MRTTGELLITVGLVVLLFCVYELKVTNLYTDREQDALAEQLEEAWAAPAPAATAGPPSTGPAPAPAPATTPVAVSLGQGLAVLRIPRLGRDYAKVVLEGVSVPDLKRGPGHYPGTALPGEIGNFVVSGHRTTYGGPFNRLDELRPGDAIIVRTARQVVTYRVTSTEIVLPSSTDVIATVPRRPGAKPTKAVLTLTTCHPEYSATERLVVFAELASIRPAADSVGGA